MFLTLLLTIRPGRHTTQAYVPTQEFRETAQGLLHVQTTHDGVKCLAPKTTTRPGILAIPSLEQDPYSCQEAGTVDDTSVAAALQIDGRRWTRQGACLPLPRGPWD